MRFEDGQYNAFAYLIIPPEVIMITYPYDILFKDMVLGVQGTGASRGWKLYLQPARFTLILLPRLNISYPLTDYNKSSSTIETNLSGHGFPSPLKIGQ